MSERPDGGPVLTIHRSAHVIGGNCIELSYAGHRVLLDAGSPLASDTSADSEVPPTLNPDQPVDAVIVSHPHQDHYGLLYALPASWPVWCGVPTETLMRMTAAVQRRALQQTFNNYANRIPFDVGPFRITPFLTDHSAYDAHMLQIDVGGRRVLYSGDFRRSGRKRSLLNTAVVSPPQPVDVLLMEGTTLGRPGPYPDETDLEDQFVTLFKSAPGRVFVSWSAQNIDRTVTLYRACKRAGRTLVIDVYTADVLDRLTAGVCSHLPRIGFPHLCVVVTRRIARMYADPNRMNRPDFLHSCCRSGRAFSATKLTPGDGDVIMLRPSLFQDYLSKGLTLRSSDTWVFSMWEGYLEQPCHQDVLKRFMDAGAAFTTIHTSGHASPDVLKTFAAGIDARHLVPIHSFDWDKHLDDFANVRRLSDGEPFAIA